MSWAKLDDGFWMHPKTIMAGNVGAGVFARMLSYCGCYLTDGLVPSAIVTSIVGSDKKVLPEMERVGLIEILESGGVIIPDYLDYNRSKMQVEADRKVKQQNGSKGGRPRSVTL
jgi:hypothetical protein